MGQALYRKYRSKNLDEIVGQEHITKTLSNALQNNQISHAYLLTGPRGVGKTSVARILAHEVNNIEYKDDTPHLDIIEIDAASNRRIDEIRELRERVNIAPTSLKYKVYIIDEVHMLTKEAFNALLKTLEEPPAHVIFVLATTEANKVPDTISSRTQQFKFRTIPVSQLIHHLKHIAKLENIKVSDQALKLIAEHGQGSFRDSISFLDQVSSSNNEISQESVEELLGLAPESIIADIIKSVETYSANTLIDHLKIIDEAGYNISLLCKQLIDTFRQQLISGSNTLPDKIVINLMKALIDVPTSIDPSTMLEISLLESAYSIKPISQKSNVTVDTQNQVATRDLPLKKTNVKNNESNFDANSWEKTLELIKNQHNTLYGIAKLAIPLINEDTLTLTFKYPFHEKKISEDRNRRIIAKSIKDVTGKNVLIKTVVDKTTSADKIVNEDNETNERLKTISNIFGNDVVIE